MQRITRNLILNKDFEYNSLNSDWAIDHDDASSWFEDHENVLVYGAHKWRDGIHKHYVHNLYVTPADAATNSLWGIGWYTPNTNSSVFSNNTFCNWSPTPQFHYTWSVPLPSADFSLYDNAYYTLNKHATAPFLVGGSFGKNVTTLAGWQKLTQNDARSTHSTSGMDLPKTVAIAEEYLRMKSL